jgi:CheY-like chemotaxis protein
MSIAELIGFDDVRITAAGSGREALAAMRERAFDCVVLDLRLPDISGFDLLSEIQQDASLRDTPIVVFTGRDLSENEETELRQKAKSIVLKGVRSPERLLDETALFLHRMIADLPASKQRMIETLHQSDEPLQQRKVLVVDDDIRNIFALNSVLERHKMQVISATNGHDAIDIVEQTDDLALVLMDVMMPEMDGYETMRRIRNNPKFRLLPIIALTAKAMKGDREKCLEAGASDYVAKPVNTEQLLSLVRMWLHR